MKNILSLFTLLLPLFMLAQEGTVTFTEKMDVHRQLMGTPREAFIDRIPQFRTVTKLLHYSETASLYKTRPMTEQEEAELAADNSRGARWRMRMAKNASVNFHDIANEQRIDVRDFFGRIFLIEDAPKPFKWKLIPEQKEILGYNCMKASHTDTSNIITVWFTSEIASATGPDGLNGLPGLILAVDINDGERIIMAEEVNTEKLKKNTLKKPTEGKKVTDEEFKAIVEEKMKEREAEFGGRGRGIRP